MFYLQYLEIVLEPFPSPCSIQIHLLHAPSQAQRGFQLIKPSLQQLIPYRRALSPRAQCTSRHLQRSLGTSAHSHGRVALVLPQWTEWEGGKSREEAICKQPGHEGSS